MMLGIRSSQRGLFEADHLYLRFVGEDSFYGFLARQRGQLFRDEDFAGLYCPDNGRPSVPPSQLATALLLQTHDGVSDEEAKDRADYDLRWKVALGVDVDDRPFAKSTLQLFRAQLVLKEKMSMVFRQSLTYALQAGYLKPRHLRAVLDTTNILGRGAVKDSYNLLADGIRRLMCGLAENEAVTVEKWVHQHGLERYLAPSIKGEAAVDWDDEQARQAFLQGLVAEGERLLELSQEVMTQMPESSEQSERIRRAGALLRQLIQQDTERTEAGVALKQGVAKDRVVSVQDPEMRHGRKSRSKRFDGHKAAIAVDPQSQLITAVEVLAGNAADHEQALELTEASEENTGLGVDETIGDCAYGDGETRQRFADANRKLVAKVAAQGRRDQITKDQFQIDLDQMTCTCPDEQTTHTLIQQGYWQDRAGERHPKQAFLFDATICAACRLRPECIKAKGGKGRTIRLHPQERLLQEARVLQKSPAFKEYCQMRQAAEHRLARLVQLGIRQARYFGRKKTLFQLLMAATVANLTLVATKTGQIRAKSRHLDLFFSRFSTFTKSIWVSLSHLGTRFDSASLQKSGFRLSF
jgi:hypothetical protein